ncbi:MAG: A/G-specific adenine glycosylase [Synechococcus sp.]
MLAAQQDLPHTTMRQQLLHWYDREGRSLPWRETDDPYAIWVSEIMLQQTQVKTVLPYYHRWLDAFPTIFDLATAPRDRVLKQWEGLGYYSRARNFHRAAQMVMERYDGRFPDTLEAAVSLPGIGRTTAGGILSAAFNQPAAILDGNVKRVLARLIVLPKPPAKALKQLWQLSESLLDPDNSRDYNQALLDLGATLCRPRQPDCPRCPWQAHCTAFNTLQQHQFPMKSPKTQRPHKQIAIAIVVRQSPNSPGRNGGVELLIDRRPEEGMLGGLWEFPGGKIEVGETAAECAVREVKEEVGLDVEMLASLGAVDHAYTHFSVTLNAYICRYMDGVPQPLEVADVRWVSFEQLKDYAFPVANQKIFPLLEQWLKQSA